MKKFATISLALRLLPSGLMVSEQITILAGSFQMGCSTGDSDCEKDEGAQRGVSVSVPAYKIDKNEVTVAEYNQCMKVGKCSRPKDHQRNKYCNLGASGRENHPVNCVDWKQTADYCTWKGQRLLYEAEWEKAARAGSTNRYPWGQDVSCKQAILDDGKTMGSVKDEPDGCGEDRTWSVGSREQNAFGLYDMHGNAGEWTANWYGKSAYKAYADGNLAAPETVSSVLFVAAHGTKIS